MMTSRRRNARTPEKDTELRVNPTPPLSFALGFVVVRGLLRSAQGGPVGETGEGSRQAAAHV